MSSAICFNLDQSKMLSSGYALIVLSPVDYSLLLFETIFNPFPHNPKFKRPRGRTVMKTF